MRSVHQLGKSASMLRSTVDAITCVSSAGFSSGGDALLVLRHSDDSDATSVLSADVDGPPLLPLPDLTSRRSLFS